MSLRIAGTAWGAVLSAAALAAFVASANADAPAGAKPPAEEECGDCAADKDGKTDRGCRRDAKPEDAKPEKGTGGCRMGRGPGGPASGGMGRGGPGRMGHGRDAAWERDPYAVRLIQAHAAVVDLFVGRGRAEMRRDHAVPERPAAPAPEARPDGR
jgi:hypothetical protein